MKLQTWEWRFSVLSTRSSIFSPRSRTCIKNIIKISDSAPNSPNKKHCYDPFNQFYHSTQQKDARAQETELIKCKRINLTQVPIKHSNSNESIQAKTMVCYLFNVFHHDSFNFWDLSFYFSKLAYLLRVINTILHMLLQFGPAHKTPYFRIHIKHNHQTSNSLWHHKGNAYLPKLLAQAICNSCSSFSSTISLDKILLDSLKKGNW